MTNAFQADKRSGPELVAPSGVHVRPVPVQPYVTRVTPAPMVSAGVLAMVQAAYRLGWENRAQIEHAVRRGDIESPEDGEKVEPLRDFVGSCLMCGSTTPGIPVT